MNLAHLVQENAKVVFITALGLEATAVESHLQETAEVVHPSGSIYTTGTIPAWKCRVAVVETGATNDVAAVETERAIQFFSPNYLVFVGVGGGIKDVVVGDVVAANRVHGYPMRRLLLRSHQADPKRTRRRPRDEGN